MNQLNVACLFVVLAALPAKADSCSSAVPGAQMGPNPEARNWSWGDACYISWPGGYIDGKNARFTYEPRCKEIPGFLSFIGDYGSNVNTCVFKPASKTREPINTSPRDTRNDYEYQERPPARDQSEPYQAPVYVPPAPPPTDTYQAPLPSSSSEDDDAASEERENNLSERAAEAERRSGLEERIQRLQEQVQSQQKEIQRSKEPPKPRKWRSIAVTIESNTFSPDRSAAGESYGYDAQDKARLRALQECRKQQIPGCGVEHSWDRGCHYLVLSNSTNRATWGSGPTIAQARQNCRSNSGLQNCNSRVYGGCEPNE